MILIIGGSGDLGNELIRNISKENDVLVVSNKRFSDTKKIFKANSKIKNFFKVNLENPDELDYFLKATLKKYLPVLRGMVLNYAKSLSADNLSQSKITNLFNLNYSATAIIYSSILEYRRIHKSTNEFRIVNVLSNSLKTLNASSEHYIATKASIESFSKFYAKTYGKIFVINNVAPGLMYSNLTKARFNNVEDEIIKKTPRGTLVKTVEVAEFVTYLINSSPRSLTGQTIFIDGGRTI